MIYYKLKVSCVLKQDLEFKNMFEELSKFINLVFLMDKNLKDLHGINTFKMYSFDGLYPATKEGYKKFNLYGFHLKTIDRTFALKMNSLLRRTESDLLNIISVEMESLNTGNIKELYTVTPCISVIDKNKHWTNNDYPIDILIDRINSNAMKKYEHWFGEEVGREVDFIKDIEQVNNTPIVLPYKKGILLTNKFKIKVKEDKESQKLARMAFITGLLEKNSLGLGYCTIGK